MFKGFIYYFIFLVLHFSMNSIKHSFWVFSLMLMSFTAAQAQSSLPARRGGVAPKPRAAAPLGPVVKDGFVMEKGRVILTEQGTTNPLTEDKTLRNGVVVTSAGIVKATDGTTAQMVEGDYVSLTGRLTTHASIVEADSLLKIKNFDLKYPGKRKKMEEEKARKEKEKAKRDEAKAKAKAKRK